MNCPVWQEFPPEPVKASDTLLDSCRGHGKIKVHYPVGVLKIEALFARRSQQMTVGLWEAKKPSIAETVCSSVESPVTTNTSATRSVRNRVAIFSMNAVDDPKRRAAASALRSRFSQGLGDYRHREPGSREFGGFVQNVQSILQRWSIVPERLNLA